MPSRSSYEPERAAKRVNKHPKTRSGARKPKTAKPWFGMQYRRDLAKLAARALETPAERADREARKKAFCDSLWRPEQALWRIEFLLEIERARMLLDQARRGHRIDIGGKSD